MEETGRSEEVDQPNYEDGPVSSQSSPSKRPRSSCALADLLGPTFASTKNNATAKLQQLSSSAKQQLSSSERVFSSAGDFVNAQRSVLKPEHVDQLVFLHKNLKIK